MKNRKSILLIFFIIIAVFINFSYKSCYDEPFEQFTFLSSNRDYIEENIINPVDTFYLDANRGSDSLFFDSLSKEILNSTVFLNFEIEVKDSLENIVYHKRNKTVRILNSTIRSHGSASVARRFRTNIQKGYSCKIYNNFKFNNAQIFEWISFFNKKRGEPFTFYFRGVLINSKD